MNAGSCDHVPATPSNAVSARNRYPRTAKCTVPNAEPAWLRESRRPRRDRCRHPAPPPALSTRRCGDHPARHCLHVVRRHEIRHCAGRRARAPRAAAPARRGSIARATRVDARAWRAPGRARSPTAPRTRATRWPRRAPGAAARDRCRRCPPDGLARLELGAVAFEDLALGGALRVRHVDAQHEAVELRLRQWIGALELARILRRQHQEILGQRVLVALGAHLPLFHGFEQRGLRLRSGAVDLVHQHHVGEQRPAPEHEFVLRRIEHVHADDVAGHEIGGALHALELAAEHARQRLRQQRLAEAGQALHQHVAARDQRDAQRADHVLGADDDARQFALHGLFEACDRRVHVFSRRSS